MQCLSDREFKSMTLFLFQSCSLQFKYSCWVRGCAQQRSQKRHVFECSSFLALARGRGVFAELLSSGLFPSSPSAESNTTEGQIDMSSLLTTKVERNRLLRYIWTLQVSGWERPRYAPGHWCAFKGFLACTNCPGGLLSTFPHLPSPCCIIRALAGGAGVGKVSESDLDVSHCGLPMIHIAKKKELQLKSAWFEVQP